ncbi:MAG: DUF962 domain-containing protein [Bacteroidetes bacterium]|nr:DUF962 domain-containing protein [Bacteroidota bacterium]
MNETRFKSFSEFYPFYLSEHKNKTCRILHFIGTTLFFVFLMGAFLFHEPRMLILCPLAGYGFAWVGHFFFEKNKPATFKYPLWSLLGDFRMYFEIIGGKENFA